MAETRQRPDELTGVVTGRRSRPVYHGDSLLGDQGQPGGGEWVERDGQRFYRISGVHAMPPFFLSLVSGFDHWCFVSSTGGLTCGRRVPENALFPYTSDDKIHDASETTGPLTMLLVERAGRTSFWQPMSRGPLVYSIERNLYKNVPGTTLVFEEINHDLGLVFSSSWSCGDRFGFIRRSSLRNIGHDEVRVELLDGLRNLLPYGVDRAVQSEMSTLVDGYKQAEAVPGLDAALYTLSSIVTDRAEPSEALKATVVWSTGLDRPQLLLSEDQLPAFRAGHEIRGESAVNGKRGAFFVHSTVTLPAQATRGWTVLADLEQGPARTADLMREIRGGVSDEAIEDDIAAGLARLERLAGCADAFQCSGDELVTGRHFSSTLSNIMRGGVFPHGYVFPRADFLEFVGERNRPLVATVEAALATVDGPLTLAGARELAEKSGDETFARLVDEYLPLSFSRRHGDPSRPWNHFSIELDDGNGTEYHAYQGNWRDIFQNWEALAISYPDYAESFVAKFVNASTADGYNPYRISRQGIDWEVPEPDSPWSNIGYWGDHQVGYLLRLLELSRDHHPGRLAELLCRDRYVYADVPYRITSYTEMLERPRETVSFDEERARAVGRRAAAIGGDGTLVTLGDGSIYRVNLLEKLLLAALVRVGNLVPGGGIWMNTQRPEWNDANNALVGYGLSMVTLCYLRRYLQVLRDLLEASDAAAFDVSGEVATFFDEVGRVLNAHAAMLDGLVTPGGRRAFMDEMGPVGEAYRTKAYAGMSGERVPLERGDLLRFIGDATAWLDHSICGSRRADGLYHAYNLIEFRSDGYAVEPLQEMLEGQVAVMSSGAVHGDAALALLDALRESALYRADQNSYVLYPNRTLPSFLEKNVIPAELVASSDRIVAELAAGRNAYVERDGDGRVHFNGIFRNAAELRAALDDDPSVGEADADRMCEVFEAVFRHRRFTGRSGSMYKYEGLGCIYWHMVSKLLLATGEVVERGVDDRADADVVARLCDRFDEIREGLGIHKTPAAYGAFPFDSYSHTPGFAGVQQPLLTGQVKEDVITRFGQLGVRVVAGRVAFEPVILARDEFLTEPTTWTYSVGDEPVTEPLPAGSLAFTLCGVPVVYRLAAEAGIKVFVEDGSPVVLSGSRLDPTLSRSLFARERIERIVVDVPETALR